jgi:hypothetical protein
MHERQKKEKAFNLYPISPQRNDYREKKPENVHLRITIASVTKLRRLERLRIPRTAFVYLVLLIKIPAVHLRVSRLHVFASHPLKHAVKILCTPESQQTTMPIKIA